MNKINRVIYRFWHNKSVAGRIGYIGKDKYYPSRFNLYNRAQDPGCMKLFQALRKYPLKIWKKEILKSGFRSDFALVKAEKFYIKKFDSKKQGYNCTEGGLGSEGRVLSDKTKKKIGKANRGRKRTLQVRKRMSRSHTGKKHSQKTRSKISKALTGRKFSLEHLQNMSKAQTGKKATLKTRRKMSQARKGFKHSPESKAKMSLSQMGNTNSKGVIPSMKTRKKISEALKGRKFTPEWCKNISKGHIGLKASPKTRKKLSKIRKGKGNPNWGKHHSAKTLRKMSLSLKASWAKRKANGKQSKSNP